jgi:hypothetical protein
MVKVANNSETAKAVVHHAIKRLSARERKNTLVIDLYSLFPAAIQMNNQETNPHTMHSAKIVNQDSIAAPMSIPTITSRKEINAASFSPPAAPPPRAPLPMRTAVRTIPHDLPSDCTPDSIPSTTSFSQARKHPSYPWPRYLPSGDYTPPGSIRAIIFGDLIGKLDVLRIERATFWDGWVAFNVRVVMDDELP